MKVVEKSILGFQENHFFSPVRSKLDYASIIIRGARLLLLNIETMDTQTNAQMKLVVDRMSRLFFFKEKKYFSVSFPFKVTLDDLGSVVGIDTYSGKPVSNREISAVIAILESNEFQLSPSLIDVYIDPSGIEAAGVFLLEEIFQFEPSYIRYDHDPANKNGLIHPLNHLDVNYSQYGTYKVGLNNPLSKLSFEDIQDIKTDCSFLQPAK